MITAFGKYKVLHFNINHKVLQMRREISINNNKSICGHMQRSRKDVYLRKILMDNFQIRMNYTFDE